MKKILTYITLLFLIIYSVGCIGEKDTLVVPSGIPLIAIGGTIENSFSVTTTEGAAVLKTELMKGEADAIIAPINLGVGLYNQGVLKYSLAKVITSSNIYIVSRNNNKLDSIEDLEGKTVYSYGDGQPADKVLKYIKEKSGVDFTIYNNGIDSVSTVVTSYFASGEAQYILCAEPFITNIKNKLKIEINVLDLSAVANELGEQSLPFLPLACLYLNNSNDEEKNIRIISAIKKNMDDISGDKNKYVDKLLRVSPSRTPFFSSMGEATLKSVIVNSGIVFEDAYAKRTDIAKYLTALGLSLKDEGIYYEEK